MIAQHLVAPETEVHAHVLEPFLSFSEVAVIEESEEERALQKMLERGRTEGLKQAQEGLRPLANALASGVQTLNLQMKSAREELERDVVKLSVAIARKVVMHELATRPETIKEIVHSLVEEAEDRKVSAVRLNSADHERLCESGMTETLEQAGIAVQATDDIQAGGCVVETAFGRLDARVETRLDEIAASLLGTEKQTEGDTK